MKIGMKLSVNPFRRYDLGSKFVPRSCYVLNLERVVRGRSRLDQEKPNFKEAWAKSAPPNVFSFQAKKNRAG
jgi:hypothetical protein